MPAYKIDSAHFKSHFGQRPFIYENDISQYLESRQVRVTENTLRWHIHQLKKSNLLSRVKRGIYTLSKKRLFTPELDKKNQQLYNKLKGAFTPDLPVVIWSTEWLTRFMVMQPTQNMVIFETEKDWTESLFNMLKDEGLPVFLDPSKLLIEQYILDRKEAYIVRPLISRAPIQKTGKTDIPTLEKILVDVFSDDDLFLAYQGTELKNIFSQSWKEYSLNVSIMLNYARRRRRNNELNNFISTLPDQELYEIFSE
jgi:hypothetical protein